MGGVSLAVTESEEVEAPNVKCLHLRKDVLKRQNACLYVWLQCVFERKEARVITIYDKHRRIFNRTCSSDHPASERPTPLKSSFGETIHGLCTKVS